MTGPRAHEMGIVHEVSLIRLRAHLRLVPNCLVEGPRALRSPNVLLGLRSIVL